MLYRSLKKNLSLSLLITATGLSLAFTSICLAGDKKTQSVDDELKLTQGDEAGNEVKALKAELLISSSDEKALAQLNKLLKKYTGTPMEASLRFRLAEIYMRRAKTATFFEVHRDDSNVVRFSPLATQNASSKAWVTKAVDTYDLIEKKFVHYTDMDLVLFNNAFARQLLGQDKAAISRYRQVIENFSESPLVPDCHLAIGEALFTAKSFQASYDEFQEIRKFPEARIYPYGLYKGAWSLYNLRHTEDALKQMEEVVAYTKKPAEEGTNRLDLTREALDDMVTFYEDVRNPKDAVAYFREQGGDTRAGDLVLKLGKIYQRHGRFNNLEVVYTDLIKAVPQAPERPQMHRDLMDGYENTKNRHQVILQLEALSNLCNDKSEWTKQQTPESRKDCWTALEEGGKIYVSKWHKEYKKNNDPELGQLTARAYEGLLKNDQRISGEDKMRFAFGELSFQQNNFRKASEQYSKVAHITKDAKLRHDGAYGALVSLEKAVGDKWSDADETLFIALANDYVMMNPKGPYVTDVKFKKAFIAYEKGRYDEAAPQLKDLAVQYFTSERGLKAARLYLDVLNLQKKYAVLRDESMMFLTKFNLDEATRAEFKKVHQEAAFTVVQNQESAGQYHEAMNGYLAFMKEDTQSALADKALYNAVRCANLSSDLASAARLSEELIKEYPESTYKNELAHSLVTLYEAQAQLGLAGATLLRLAQWEPTKSASYLLSGADYKALNNEWTEATRIYQQLAQKPNTPEGQVAVERMEALAERNSQWEKASKLLEEIVEEHIQPQASLAAHKLAQKAFDDKSDDKAFKLAKRTVGMRNEKNVSAWALGQSRLIQAKILEKEFDQAGVKAKPDRLSMVLAIKTEKLEHAQRAYQEAIAFGDKPTAIEALVRLAKCYEKYSAALNTIEAPADATPADQKKFKEEIENMALPIEEKNAETLQVALKQAKDLQLHDETVASIQGELNRLRRSNRKMTFEMTTPGNVLPVVN